ncbi:MAG: hypothetical protein U0Q55_00040 [Vicinamibacterales bacterium]
MTMLMPAQAEGPLPRHFRRPTRYREGQLALFQLSFSECLHAEGVGQAEAQLWHERGLLSFAPDPALVLEYFDDPRSFELGFVRDVLRSGLTLEQATAWLEILGYPFAFNPATTVWSPRYGWVEYAPEEAFDIVKRQVGHYIESLAEAEDEDALTDIKDAVDNALKLLEEK